MLVWLDARLCSYEYYSCFDYPISIAPNGDRPDRYPSRSNEIIEPRRIIYAIPFVMLKSILPASLYRIDLLCSLRDPSMYWPLRSAFFHQFFVLLVSLLRNYWLRSFWLAFLLMKLVMEMAYRVGVGLISSFLVRDWIIFWGWIIFVFFPFIIFNYYDSYTLGSSVFSASWLKRADKNERSEAD